MSTLVPSVDDASTPKHEEGQVQWVSPRQRTQKSRTIIITFSAAPDDFEVRQLSIIALRLRLDPLTWT